MGKLLLMILLLPMMSSCSAVGENWVLNTETKKLEMIQKVIVKGWGSKLASFADGSNVAREESISDIIPDSVALPSV